MRNTPIPSAHHSSRPLIPTSFIFYLPCMLAIPRPSSPPHHTHLPMNRSSTEAKAHDAIFYRVVLTIFKLHHIGAVRQVVGEQAHRQQVSRVGDLNGQAKEKGGGGK